jgi:hypothetical protein
VPIAAGIIIGIGNVKVDITEDFSLEGISLGTIVAIAGYHLARAIAPKELREGAEGTAIAVGDHVYGDSDGVDDLYQEGYPGAPGHRDPERDKRP